MRLVIIDEENNKMQVGIDGKFYIGLDGSQLPEDVHAVQWYGSAGEVEYKDPATGSITANTEITDISPFQFAIDAWNTAKAEEDAEIAAAEAAAAEAAAQEEQTP